MRNFTLNFRKLAIAMLFLFTGFAASAQLTGIKNIPGDYPDLNSAIIDLNTLGVGAGGVTFNLNQPETAPVGGYSITATGTAANQIIFMGNGNSVLAGASPAVGSRNDAIFKIIGGDYITIQGFAMTENPANTVTGALAVQQMTEFGVALFAASATDGAQNNTIQANAITLNPAYQNSIGIFSTSSSSSTNGVQAATSTAGTNSNNKFYANNISGVAFGMYFICEPITAAIFESNEDIGGSATLTGNTIQFGCNTTSDIGWTRFSATTNAGIVFRNGAGNSVQFNTISTAAGITVAMGGVFVSSGTAPTGVTYTSTISNNIITLTNPGATAITGIDFGHGISTGTIASNLNNITINENPAAGNASAVTGIKANYASATRTCNSNTIVINQTATAGTISSSAIGINEASTATTNNAVSNNITFNQSSSGTGVISGSSTLISVAGTTTTNNVQTNTLLVNETTSVVAGMNSSIVGINATSAATTLNINLNNSITFKQAVTGSGTYGAATTTYISMNATHGNVNITNNTFNTTGSTIRATGNLDCILGGGSTLTGLLTIKSNTANIDRVAASGNVGFYTQTSTAPNDPADSLSLNNITFTGLATSGTVTVINRVGGSTVAVRNICNNIISVSGTSTGTVIGILNGYSNPSLIAGNSITISCNAPTVSGIVGSTGSPTNCTIRGNTVSLTSGTTTPTAMTGIGGLATGPYQISLNNITAMNFTGVITTTPTMAGISVLVGTGNNINNNTISGISAGAAGSTASATIDGILFGGGTSVTINKNKIYGLTTQGTGNATLISGIRATVGTTVNINNNIIGLLTAPASASADAIRGININSSTGGSNVNLYYNTIYINASSTGVNFGTTGIFHAASATATTAALDMRNNLVVNTSTASGTGLIVAYRRSGTALNNYANTSNNNSFYSGTPSVTNLIFNDGTNSDQTLATYQSRVSPRDGASLSQNPTFSSLVGSSPVFLHIPAATASLLESGGTTVGSVTVDYDNDARPGPVGSVNGGALAPDIGADEFDGAILTCSGAVGGTISPATATACAGSTAVMSSAGASSGPGISYQWMISTTSGGPYSNVSGGSGATTTSYTTGSLVAGTYYYVLQVTCSAGPVTGLSNELTLTVNTSPTVSVTPTTVTYCRPGPGVVLTASGATTYSWLPATGLSATNIVNPTASPATTTTYTVTGTTAGCSSTATVAVTSSEQPGITSISATPPSVCSGGNSQLQVTAATTTTYTQSTTPFAPINSGTGTITLCNSTVITTPLTSGSLDDGYWNGIAMPFSFNFFGSTFNTINVQTNGVVSFSPFTTTTGYNVTMPNAAVPNNIIDACFGDLDWGFGNGVISCYTSGSAPNRIFVINYNGNTGGGFYNGGFAPTAFVNTQIQLFEGTNIIQVHSASISGASTVNHAQGIENAAGTTAVVVTGRNNTNWAATNDGVQFVPSGGVFTYSWTPATFLSSTTISNPMATGVTATTTYTVAATTAGCPATGTVTITSGSALNSSATITPGNTVCAGTNVTLNAVPAGGGAPYTYAWTGPNSFTSTSQNPVITSATTAASGVYTVVTTDACSATSTSTVSLTVNPLPVVAVTPTTALYCNPGTPVALSATGATTYSWGPATGLSATTGSNVNASPAATTTYTVTGTDGNGCIATATTTITSAPAVTGATASATPSAICIGSTTTLNSSANPIASTILVENFNSGAPSWTRTNTSTGGTPANAAWIDRPDGYVYAAGTPYHSNDNSQFVQSNSDAQGSGSTTQTTLRSPSFSTVGYTGLSLDFYQFYRDINDNGDSAVVESSLNGINWSIVTAYSASSGSENAFSHQTVALPAGLNNQPTVYIRFRYIATWDWYWSIDNVSIIGLSPNFTYNWTSTPSGFTSTAQNPSGVSPAVATTYTVQITNTFGCSATANTSVTVNPLPTVSATASPSTICAGASSTLTGSGATTYSWMPGSLSGTTVTVSPTTTTTYTVTGTNASGCTNTATVAVTVNPQPTVSATASPSTICAGASSTLTGSGATTYSWMPGSLSGTSVTVTPSSSTTYTVTGTNASGCTNTATVAVTVNPLPTVSATASPSSICTGASSTLTGSGATTYSWMPGSLSGTSVTVTPSSSTTYTVTGTTAAGCSGTATVAVTVNPLPTVSASASPATICAGASSTLTGSGATTYNWMPGSLSGTSVTVTPSSSATYTVTGTTAAGCTGTATVAVTVNPLPVVTLSGSNTFCAGGSSTLTGTSGGTSQWYQNGVAIPGATNNTYVATTAGVYNMIKTNVSGCSDSAATGITITVNPTPTVTATAAPTTICSGSSTTLTASGATTYNWMPGSLPGATVTVSPTTTTTYTVTGTNASGCSNTATVTITVNPIPTVTAAASSTSICTGNNVTLTGSGASTYLWNPGAISGSPITVTPASTTTYSVTGTDVNGCTGTGTITVTVGAQPTVTVTPSGATICNGSSTTLTASGTVSYNWMPGSLTGSSVVLSPSSTTTYTVTGTNGPGCFNTATVTVTVNPLPNVTATAAPATVCSGSSTTLTASGASTYNWMPGSLIGSSVTDMPASTTTYTVTGTDVNGCTNTATATVTVNPSPVVAATASPSVICSGSSATLTASGADTYTWMPGSFTGSSVTDSPTATTTYTVTGTITASGCTSTQTVTVTVNPLPVVALGNDTMMCGGSVTLDAQNTGSTYLWSDASTAQTLVASSTGNYSVTVTDVNGCAASDAIDVTINTIPVVALGADITQCGGSVTLDAGNPGASYLWSDASTSRMLTVSASGTYYVTVTDSTGSCSASDTIDVTINAVPVVNLGPDVAQCTGTVTLDAGNPGETYLWSDNTTSQTLTAGSTGIYWVDVTNSLGCTGSDTVSVIINSNPTVTLGNDTTMCGGTITLDAGNSGATYLWSDNSTSQTLVATTSGTYFVTATLTGGCNASDTIVVTINTVPVVNLGADTAQCGGTVTLNAQNAGSTYLWSDNTTNQTLTATATGFYYVDVTNPQGCSASDSVMVTINTIPTVTFTVADTVCDNGGFVTLTGSPAGGTFFGVGVIGNTFDPTVPGTGNTSLSYSYTDVNGCSASANQSVFVDDCSGINEQVNNTSIVVYPNPNNGQFTVVINQMNGEGVLEITNALGQLISSENIAPVNGVITKEINLSAYSNGMYFVRFITNATTTVEKVNVQR
jgi:hypothetical protein